MRLAAALAALLFLAAPARADQLVVRIDLSEQQMTVIRDGAILYHWPVSTARAGKFTPIGTFQPVTLKRVHYSTIYDGAPMPWSIFFRGNFAIHGTTEVDNLGTPASAGCVRLHPENAEILFATVLEEGIENTWIVVQD